ncbi:hypothetical protein CMV_027871 [Castanea mollissima]|uniref:Uncharacterized protein n=1 Tax=Castanea mollissima TaxID=60419 RepID=A0A8J4QIN7_9ROSI|nr:hypothetical protein CMV_027871 [Castanea mollissima]
MVASHNLDSEKNIRGGELKAIADTVNEHYEKANLNSYDVKEIWVEIKEYWKVWAEALKIVDLECVDCISGRITPYHPRKWETILKKVPDVVKFKSENF